MAINSVSQPEKVHKWVAEMSINGTTAITNEDNYTNEILNGMPLEPWGRPATVTV